MNEYKHYVDYEGFHLFEALADVADKQYYLYHPYKDVYFEMIIQPQSVAVFMMSDKSTSVLLSDYIFRPATLLESYTDLLSFDSLNVYYFGSVRDSSEEEKIIFYKISKSVRFLSGDTIR